VLGVPPLPKRPNCAQVHLDAVIGYDVLIILTAGRDASISSVLRQLLELLSAFVVVFFVF
jgi:hypothetical protein